MVQRRAVHRTRTRSILVVLARLLASISAMNHEENVGWMERVNARVERWTGDGNEMGQAHLPSHPCR